MIILCCVAGPWYCSSGLKRWRWRRNWSVKYCLWL